VRKAKGEAQAALGYPGMLARLDALGELFE
jgi:hypothetical protein